MRTSVAGTRGRPPRSAAARVAAPRGGAFRLGAAQRRNMTPSHVAARTAYGFTLLELMVVVAIMAMATAGVSLAMRDSSQTQLEREAQRLSALLESARAVSRMSANAVVWRATPKGFEFEGLPSAAMPAGWLGTDVVASSARPVVLGPEPIIGPQRIRLTTLSQPTRSLSIATDGVRPFKVMGDADATPDSP